MADLRTARPVSGEIMAGDPIDPRTAPRPSHGDDLVEAEYEDLGEVRPAPPALRNPEPKALLPDGMDMLSGRAAPAKRFARGGPLFWLAGLALVGAAFWFSGGYELAGSVMPAGETGTALTISGVSSRVDVSGPKPLLFVDGTAANGGAQTAVLPELEIRVTGQDGAVTRYNLGTSGRTMGPGETFAFSSRLDVPKNGVKTVSVLFAQ